MPLVSRIDLVTVVTFPVDEILRLDECPIEGAFNTSTSEEVRKLAPVKISRWLIKSESEGWAA